MLAVACDTDVEAGRWAREDEYELRDRWCELDGELANLGGTLVNRSGDDHDFGLTIQLIDGDIAVGDPVRLTSQVPVADGDTWDWETSTAVGSVTNHLWCDVRLVTLGDAVPVP
jgi:hypothetical protein